MSSRDGKRMPMQFEQRALRFTCKASKLFGIVSLPAQPLGRGVLMVTGGPQYRVGSHRQFLLLAQQLARAGVAVMRFDYRGMGDSEGAARTYDQIDDDIAAAVDAFVAQVPGLKEIVIWGLCDGASAAAYYAYQDSRICGVILLNPWVRTASGIARATLRHYYLAQLVSSRFWRKLLSGRFKAGAALQSLRANFGSAAAPAKTSAGTATDASTPPQRLFETLSLFTGRILIILSGDDLTAREFEALPANSKAWRTLLSKPNVQQSPLAQANHTFSRAVWRDEVGNICAQWLASW